VKESSITIILTNQEYRYFEQAARTGLYGVDLEDTIKRLALDKVQQAIVAGILKLELPR
jgi:hypothetical protein